MKNNFLILVFLFSLCTAGSLSAQMSKYSCDFENQSENAQWQLNTGIFGDRCVNRWYIGTAANNGGRNGLYISSDGGNTPNYKPSSLVAVAQRDITLAAGKYEVSLDWQAGSSRTNILYLCWVPDTVQTVSNINGFLPNFVERYAVAFNDSIKMSSSNWHTTADTIVSDGSPHKLVLVWQNRVEEPALPSACVDNIDILPVDNCHKPTNVTITSEVEKIIISWSGDAEAYDLRYKSSSDNLWHEQYGLTDNFFVSTDIDEGICDVYVRSACGGDKSGWVSYNQFIFFVGARCVDYLSLNKENCYYGVNANPRAVRGMLNYGPLNIKSRHTIHYDKAETDPRTDFGLRTVPDGELASVRLGNWDYNGEGEAVEFRYTVDAESSAILLLKYAVVLENPEGHGYSEMPRFTLDILDANKPLRYGCGNADFAAGFDTEDWNVTQNGTLWKDWTTVGINLAEYDGKTLTIRLTTIDCSLGGHYGYAYFAIGCSNGQIQGLSCGDTPTTGFSGPDGFKYVWYLPDNPLDTLSTEQTYSVLPDDTLTYYCNVIQPTNPRCYYTISATAIPRWPAASASYIVSSKNCANTVAFTNESYIKLVNPITKDTTILGTGCESAHWDFGDGSTSEVISPIHQYPNEGGTYYVTLEAGLASGLCTSQYTFEVSLPRMMGVNDTIVAFSCEGTAYPFHGKNYFKSGFYCDSTIDQVTGCYNVEVLNLTVVAPTDTIVYDTICSAMLPYEFNGQQCNGTGSYVANLKSLHGCDSTVTLMLEVNESLEIAIADTINACINDGDVIIPYHISSGFISSYDMTFDTHLDMNIVGGEPVDEAVVIPVTDAVLPGCYRATIDFENMECGNYIHTIVVNINYPDTIIAQRWNDVLAIQNATYNGGYNFSAFQWYVDGVAIDGATNSILYLPEGLDVGANYYAALTRANDGVLAYTCRVQPIYIADVVNSPIVTFSGSTLTVQGDVQGVARLWSMSGQCVASYPLLQLGNTINVNAPQGIYLLVVTLDDGTSITEKIIISEQK